MRRGVGILVFGVVLAVLGLAASSRASGAGGTTTTGTTAATTTTGTTTPAPSYARLEPSYLPAGCVGAGAAVIEEPGRPPLALGTPASSLGPSAYPTGTPLVAFDSLAASGSTCSSTSVTLASVSLFGGAVTASSVSGTAGRGAVTGLQIEGTDVSLAPGQMVAVGDWAQVTLDRKVGRARALLVLSLLAQRGALPPGTVIAVGFEAAPEPLARPKPTPEPTHPQADGQSPPTVDRTGATARATRSEATKKHRQQPRKPPPDFPAAPNPLTVGGGLTSAAQENAVVSIARQYLGVPYKWAGASPATGFDCSGLVQYVFAQLGVPMVHNAAAQWYSSDGVWVPPNRLQPGDLVFFTGSDGTRKEPGHVGIYVDDGYIIDAPHTGTFVRVDTLTEPMLANEYVGAKRILGASPDARHLLVSARPEASVSGVLRGFPSPVTLGAVVASPGIAAAGTATARTAARDHWVWVGVALGSLLLLLFAGALVVRRRRTPGATPSGEAAD